MPETQEPPDDFTEEIERVFAVLGVLEAIAPAQAESDVLDEMAKTTIETYHLSDHELNVARAKLRIQIERSDTIHAVAKRLRQERG